MAELRYHAADQGAAASMPLQIDRAMKIARAMDFRPTMRAPRLFGPGFDKAEFPLQLRISRDLAAQRSAPGRDDLNHRLHRSLGSTAVRVLQRRYAKVDRTLRRSIHLSIVKERAKHDVNIDKPFLRMPKCARQSANDLEIELLPEMNR